MRVRKNKVADSGAIIPMCNCKLHRQHMEMHETKQYRNICSFCEHYVYWGTWRECSASFDQVKSNNIKDTVKDGAGAIGYPVGVMNKAKELYIELKSMRKVALSIKVSRDTLYTWKKNGWTGKGR